jgi:hypothetical protein
MLSIRRRRYACMTVALLVLSGCTTEKEPAQRAISDIEAVVFAARAEGAKYVPEQMAEVQTGVRELTASFDRKDYPAVLAGAPAVMSAAQRLAPAAAARKAEVTRALEGQWSGLAARLPERLAMLQSRIDMLGQKSSKKLAAGMDLEAARDDLSRGASLWSKAQASFATGNLSEAVATGNTLEANLNVLAGTLKVDLNAPAVSIRAPTSPR